MPYTDAQLRLFAAKARRGESVPSDWKSYARKQLAGKPAPDQSSRRRRKPE